MSKDEKEEAGEDRSKQKPKVSDLYGWQRGSVIIPPGFDLTKPVLDEPFSVDDDEFYEHN